MMRPSILVLGAALLMGAPLQGQAKIPPGHIPPPGMCRVWLDGVPPGRQPAVTDCATAVRSRPRGSRVIFGDDYARGGRGSSSRNGGVYDERRDDGCYSWDPRCAQRGTVINSRDRRDQPCFSWDPRCVQDRDRDRDRDRAIDARERARREAILRAQRDRDRDRRSDWCRDGNHNGRCDNRDNRKGRR